MLSSMKIIFFSIFLTLFGAIHFLAKRRIVDKLHISAASKKFFYAFLVTNYMGNIGYVLARYVVDVPKPLYALLSMSIGVTFLIFTSIIFYELLHIFQRKIPFKKNRRKAFKRVSDVTFLSATAAITGISAFEGTKTPIVQRVKVNQNNFENKRFKIVQISDMHIGGLIDKEFVKRSVEQINRLNADLVTITGDLTDLPIDKISTAVDELKNIKSRFGVFYVPGNHEYFHGLKETLEHIQKLGIIVLGNESKDLGPFWVVGVYDIFGYRYGKYMPDIYKATESILDDKPTLLLAHQPRFMNYLHGFKPSLTLCGHTHGGQIWPFNHLVKLQQPYVAGLYKLENNRYIYVNSGIGFWGPPMRLGTKAEITLIEWS